jgi:hypothetical protein
MKKERLRTCEAGKSENDEALTILDNVLTVVESAGCEEQAGQPHPHPGGLQEGAGGDAKKVTAAKFAEALWRYMRAAQNV